MMWLFHTEQRATGRLRCLTGHPDFDPYGETIAYLLANRTRFRSIEVVAWGQWFSLPPSTVSEDVSEMFSPYIVSSLKDDAFDRMGEELARMFHADWKDTYIVDGLQVNERSEFRRRFQMRWGSL